MSDDHDTGDEGEYRLSKHSSSTHHQSSMSDPNDPQSGSIHRTDTHNTKPECYFCEDLRVYRNGWCCIPCPVCMPNYGSDLERVTL